MPANGEIYFGFSASAGDDLFNLALGAGIRFVTGGDSNHAFMLYYDELWGTWLTVGANINGVTPIWINAFLKDRKITHLYRAKGFNPWDGMRAHVGDLDAKYDLCGMVNMAFVKTVEKIEHHPVANLLAGKSRLYCSEWVSEIVKTSMLKAVDGAIYLNWPVVEIKDDVVDPTFLQDAMERYKRGFEAVPFQSGLALTFR